MNASNSRTRIAVVGGGAVGGFLAAKLAAAGHDVTLCVRTPIPALVVESAGETIAPPITIATDPARIESVPWVFLATKAQDTAAAAPWLRRLAGAGTHVVVAQNGIEHRERVAAHVGGATVIPSVVFISGERTAPGRIVHRMGQRLQVPAGAPGETLAALCAGSGVEIKLEPDFVTEAWRKLLVNITSNPLTALTLRRMGVFREPGLLPLARALMAEGVAVGKAEGARLDPGDVERTLDGFRSMSEAAGTSMLYDRLAGAPMEHEFLTGAMVRAAERHGIDVPMNRAMLALMRALEDGQRRR